jgi:hypothetical protein
MPLKLLSEGTMEGCALRSLEFIKYISQICRSVMVRILFAFSRLFVPRRAKWGPNRASPASRPVVCCPDHPFGSLFVSRTAFVGSRRDKLRSRPSSGPDPAQLSASGLGVILEGGLLSYEKGIVQQ